jgi:hypothetical protein
MASAGEVVRAIKGPLVLRIDVAANHLSRSGDAERAVPIENRIGVRL